MVLRNTAAIGQSVAYQGESVSVRTYPDKESPSYNSDTEVPSYGTPVDTSVLALVMNPLKKEIEASGGKVTVESKKFVFNKSVSVGNGDLITYASNKYEVVETQTYLGKITVFANLVPSVTV